MKLTLFSIEIIYIKKTTFLRLKTFSLHTDGILFLTCLIFISLKYFFEQTKVLINVLTFLIDLSSVWTCGFLSS
jgi:hypothetical protein